jgi:hypothetical protein
LAVAPALAAEKTFSKEAGVEFSEVVATVVGEHCKPEAHNPSGSIEWGDGQSSSATLEALPAAGNFLVRGSHTYLKPGTYKGTFTGGYFCQAVEWPFTPTAFTAEVAGTEKTTPTPPPPPPPQVHAAFAIQSVTAGKAVLDAAASVPAGTVATNYSWNVTGGAQPDAVCQGSEPQLTVQSAVALNTTASLTAVDAATGVSTVVSQHLAIPAPSAPALKGKVARAHAAIAPAHALTGAVTPSFKVIGTCTGAGVPLPLSEPYRTAKVVNSVHNTAFAGGAPSPQCAEETQFGAADIQGCLGQVEALAEIPGGVTLGLAGLLCGAKQTDFCVPSLGSLGGTAESAFGAAAHAGVSTSGPLAHSALNLPAAQSAVARALIGVHMPVFYSNEPIRINGLDVDPVGGSPIIIVPAADLVIALDVRIYLHGVPLVQLPALVLHLPDFGGRMGELRLPKSVPVIGSLPFNGSIAIDLHRAGTRLPNGDTCTYACSALSVNLELPGVFSDENGNGLSAGAVLTADDQQGLQLSSFELSIPQADLGGIGISDVLFRYLHANDSLHGGATLDLGPVGDIGATVDFIHGHFNGASLEYSAGVGPGIDLGGPIPIFLTRLGGGFTLEPPVIEANGEIAGGPNVLGCALFGIDASIELHFEPEFALDANGTGEMLCQSVASEYFHLDGAGHIGLGAAVHLHFLVFSLEGGFRFDIDTAHGHFQADGNVSACIDLFGEHCLGAEAVVSDRGIGVCADLGFTHAGGGIQFPFNPILFFDSCDIGKFRSLGFVTGLHGHAAAAQGFTVPKGQKVAVVGLTGSGAPPLATLTGPSGRTISTPVARYEKTPDDVVISDDQSPAKETYFFINHPEAGAWKVTLEPGSAPLTAIQQGASLPAPAIKGRVRPAGGRRERLTYSLNPILGQQVSFAEKQADGNFRMIGAAKGRRGTLVFSPSPDLGRTRSIEAMVTQDGRPREDVVIAHFKLPRIAALPAPRHLRLVRRGGALLISFRSVGGAAGYGLAVRLSDGRNMYLKLPAARRGTTVAAVPTNIGARVTIGAIIPGPRLRHGRVAKARLKPGPQPPRTVVQPLRS